MRAATASISVCTAHGGEGGGSIPPLGAGALSGKQASWKRATDLHGHPIAANALAAVSPGGVRVPARAAVPRTTNCNPVPQPAACCTNSPGSAVHMGGRSFTRGVRARTLGQLGGARGRRAGPYRLGPKLHWHALLVDPGLGTGGPLTQLLCGGARLGGGGRGEGGGDGAGSGRRPAPCAQHCCCPTATCRRGNGRQRSAQQASHCQRHEETHRQVPRRRCRRPV
jgi:hypothetical protein